MSEMIERVETAIDEAIGHKLSLRLLRAAIGHKLSLRLLRAATIAAIEAMREPTEEMVKAGNLEDFGDVRRIWYYMADAALDKINA